MIPKLREQYTACCQAYADLLLKLMDKSWREAFWVGGITGGTLSVSPEDIFPMTDVCYIIDNELPYSEVEAWSYYNRQAAGVGLFPITIDAWHKGAPHATQADIDHLYTLRHEVNVAISHEGEGTPEAHNALNRYNNALEILLSSLGYQPSKI